MTWGITDAGFVLKRLEDIKQELEDDARVAYGDTVDLSSDNPLGQLIAMQAERRASDWLALQAVYNSFHASLASGISLDRVNQLRGIARRAASYSTGFVTFTGTPDVEVPQGTRVQDETGKQVETLVSAATDATTGIVTIPVRAIDSGPVSFLPATLTSLVTSVFGIDSVTNADGITGGLARESDFEFYIRSNEALSNPGTSSVEGIRTAINTLSFVRDARIAENRSDTVDAEGRPGHSFETYVLTNLAGVITDFPTEQLELAETIWNSKPGGIETVGDVSTLITDSQGFTHTVYFTEATQTNVVIALTVAQNTDPLEGDLFPLLGVDLIKTAILSYGATLNMGRDVWLNKISQAASSVPGVKGISAVTINGVADNLSIAPIELPVFDAANIEVTVV